MTDQTAHSSELMEDSVVRNFRTTESAKLCRVDCYNFNVITEVAYRVKPAPEYLAEAA